MKVGLIRCLQTEDMCAATACINVIAGKKAAFAGIEEEVVLHNMNTCGGCPGKRAVIRAENMVKNGCDAIAIASCVSNGTPIDFACPHSEQMIAAIKNRIGKDTKVFLYTH